MVNYLTLSKKRFGTTEELSLSANDLFWVFAVSTLLCIGVIVFRSIIQLTHVIAGISPSEHSPMEVLKDWQICETKRN
jgi:hypothetical protein